MGYGFNATGNSVVAVGSTASGTAVQVSTVGAADTVRLQNMSTDRAFIRLSSTGAAVTAPTSAASANGIPLEAGAMDYFKGGPNSYLTALTTVATATVRIAATPGTGGI